MRKEKLQITDYAFSGHNQLWNLDIYSSLVWPYPQVIIALIISLKFGAVHKKSAQSGAFRVIHG